MIIATLLGNALSLGVSIKGKSEVKLLGNPTTGKIMWDPVAYPSFLVLFSQNERDAATYTTKAAGLLIKNNKVSTVEIKDLANPLVQQISGTTQTAAESGTYEGFPLATFLTGFPLAEKRVHPFCIYTDVSLNEALSSDKKAGCGNFHTYAAQVQGAEIIDRNLGYFLGSAKLQPNATDPLRSANSYNVTFYASRAGGLNTGRLNAAVVAYSEGTVTDFEFWTATSTKELKPVVQTMDYVVTTTTGAAVDYYGKSGLITEAKLDTDGFNCPNNVVQISRGIARDSAALSYYSHFSRALETGDLACDFTIRVGSKLCLNFKEGTVGSITTGSSPGDGVVCAVFNWGWVIAGTLAGLLL